MIICPNKRLAFVHIYKTAGSAVTTVLAPYTDAAFRAPNPRLEGHGFQPTWHYAADQHAPYKKHADELRAAIPGWDDFTVLAVVRNPYDWLTSIYRDFYQPKVWRESGPRARFQREYPDRSLLDMIDYLGRREPADMPGNVPQTRFLDGVTPARRRIVRFETIGDDLVRALGPLGIECPVLPQVNLRSGDAKAIAAWRAEPSLIAFCNGRFGADFEAFGYDRE